MNESEVMPLDSVVQETGPDPDRAVIWLHGLGADGHDFAPIVPHLRSASRRSVRFVFPHAPVRPVTVNGGMAMRAWYDILGLTIDRDQDLQGILDSVASVNRLIADQINAGISADRIVLAGFSQGGAIALRAGLAQPQPLAGVMALSCYLLQAGALDEWQVPASANVSIFMGHGTQDPVVPIALGRAASEQLGRSGYSVEWKEYPMPHSVSPEEIQDIDRWLEQRWS
ncbi:MAG: alpha/beta fold hydrolase [Pseudomonadota bacterium]